jgi:hypothetical protein
MSVLDITYGMLGGKPDAVFMFLDFFYASDDHFDSPPWLG